jgi:hypothetical protein
MAIAKVFIGKKRGFFKTISNMTFPLAGDRPSTGFRI